MGNDSAPPEKPAPDPLSRWIVPMMLMFFGLMILPGIVTMFAPAAKIVTYTEIKSHIESGDVQKALLEQSDITLTLKPDPSGQTQTLRSATPPQGDPTLLPLLEPARDTHETAPSTQA